MGQISRWRHSSHTLPAKDKVPKVQLDCKEIDWTKNYQEAYETRILKKSMVAIAD